MRSGRFRLIALASMAALAACGREDSAPSPIWVDLARLFRPRPLEELAGELEAKVDPPRNGRIVRLPEVGGGADSLCFELPLPRALWRQQANGEWVCAIPTGGALLAAELGALVLLERGVELPSSRALNLRPGQYSASETEIRLSPAPPGEPENGLALRVPLDSGREVDGVWRASQWALACNGILVFPGAAERTSRPIPPASRLGFATVAPNPGGHGAELGPTLFRVKLDGHAIFEERESYRTPLQGAWHWVEVPGGDHELAFEVEGLAPALFATPLLAPRAIGTSGARPWREPRPDLVLVLCDTFRADNLEAWGGPTTLAPRLNRFVARSLRFLDARSAAAWTLPSIATMMTGVFPAQHGATDMDRGVASEVETVAEVLSRAGYRTAAITDSGLFSRHYAQDQGFQWFEETSVAEWSLNHTLERASARMAADDGRPLFLVVHTYRVHGPMRVGPDEDPMPAKELRRAIHDRLEERRAEGNKVKPMEVALEFLAQGASIYHDAVADLDRKVGAWIEELEAQGFFERGALVLTADHGDALGEHGQVGHGSDLFDVKLRVPLALAGRGLAPAAVAGPVSLVDLAPTLAALAGVAPSPSWAGRSLLAREPSGPLFAFDFKAHDVQIALYSEGKKLLAPDVAALRAGRPSHAFDLSRDPGEEENLAESSGWPGELARQYAGELELLTAPRAAPRLLELTPEVQAQLQAIGYGE